MSSVSGLSAPHRVRARDLAVEAALLGLRHAPQIHYSQGPHRWDWHREDLRAWRGQYPTDLDCSSYATWCLWNGLHHYHVRDTVNGERWLAGYTGTMLEHGKRVVHPENILRADLALYGHRFPGEHVAICIGSGLVISHGSENGPYKLPIHYRPDLLMIRRYI